jgi:hypothetical protein
VGGVCLWGDIAIEDKQATIENNRTGLQVPSEKQPEPEKIVKLRKPRVVIN